MKKLIVVSAIAVLSIFATGCMTSQIKANQDGIANFVKALAADPNAVHMSVVTAYGTIEVDRTGPISSTNHFTVGGANGITQ